MFSYRVSVIFACCVIAAVQCLPGISSANSTIKAGSSYELSTVKATWVKANNDCKSRGMRLVSTETAEELFLVLQLIADSELPDESYWSSGTDLGSEGEYYWDATGYLFGDTNWAPGKPNGDSDNNCVLFDYVYRHLLNDVPCKNLNYYICERHPCKA